MNIGNSVSQLVTSRSHQGAFSWDVKPRDNFSVCKLSAPVAWPPDVHVLNRGGHNASGL